MEPQRNIYDFQITVDAEFADRLRDLDVPDKQQPASDHIKGALTHDMADVRFVGDSFLLRGITVGFQATGLDLHNEERGRQTFATHNVDNSTEAIEVVAAFSRWEELANHMLEDQQEDGGLRADGGTDETVYVAIKGDTESNGEDVIGVYESSDAARNNVYFEIRPDLRDRARECEQDPLDGPVFAFPEEERGLYVQVYESDFYPVRPVDTATDQEGGR
jgi:hypothetical protein